MTHSVLVDTTPTLFRHFYRELARGAALDNARRQLYAQPARGERQRAQHQITLKLQDWFLPALYQTGTDTKVLTATAPEVPVPAAPRTNLPSQPESGFHGRPRELWDIERWFVGGTRRENLIVTPENEPELTVDNIEVAQFLYRLLRNQKIRDVIAPLRLRWC